MCGDTTSRQGVRPAKGCPSVGLAAVFLRSFLASWSKTWRIKSRRSARVLARCSGAPKVSSSRSIESRARSVSSDENVSWCAHLLRVSETSNTRARVSLPNALPNSPCQVALIPFRMKATSSRVGCRSGVRRRELTASSQTGP